MASIKIPQAAEPLLCFCATSKDSGPYEIFETYAEATTFAAALGYHLLNGVKPGRVTSFHASTEPVPLDVFRNNNMLPVLLAIGLAVDNSHAIAKDESRLCAIIEGYAQEGFLHMAKLLKRATPSTFHRELIDEMHDAHKGVDTM